MVGIHCIYRVLKGLKDQEPAAEKDLGRNSMETNILLENGTNELEILEFTLNENHYGINVAKIREILTYQPVTPIPNSGDSVEGIFMPSSRRRRCR